MGLEFIACPHIIGWASLFVISTAYSIDVSKMLKMHSVFEKQQIANLHREFSQSICLFCRFISNVWVLHNYNEMLIIIKKKKKTI